MDPVGYGRFAAVARTGRHNRCADGVVAAPKTSYFPHLMQETVCSRASSVGIPTAPDAKKVREINDLLLDIMGRRSLRLRRMECNLDHSVQIMHDINIMVCVPVASLIKTD